MEPEGPVISYCSSCGSSSNSFVSSRGEAFRIAMMRRSFRSSDGRCHNYHIHCQHECDTGPLVVYLPSTHCEAPLHQASFPFSLLTFEIEPMIGKTQ